jgi:hypothetical protein
MLAIMIKPFEILKEDVVENGTLVLYKVSKSVMTGPNTKTKTSVSSTIFVTDGLDVEEELVTHLKSGGWL